MTAVMAYRSAVGFLRNVFHGLHSLRSFHRMAIHGEPSGFECAGGGTSQREVR